MNPIGRQPLKKILHIDMDAFYASVEQRDFPGFRGKPVVVGGDPKGRGVVAAASYEARKYGIHSAMPSAAAYRLCPNAIFLTPRFDVYRAVSQQVRRIFHEFTPLVEPLSLDEAYLDVTESVRGKKYPSATHIAAEIRKKILEQTGLTASAGISFNKFLAKMASDINKPDGMYVITPARADVFLEQLEIGRFYGVGKATQEKMKRIGIRNGRDLKKWKEEDLVRHFGKAGHHYYRIVRTIDSREVSPNRRRKSVGKERTFQTDLSDLDEIGRNLKELAHSVSASLKQLNAAGKTVTLKVRYDNFETITRSISFRDYLDDPDEIASVAIRLTEETGIGERKVRLLGVTLSSLNLEESNPGRQLEIPFTRSRL